MAADDIDAATSGGWTGTVNDILGEVNNFGVTLANARERWTRAASPDPNGVSVQVGKPAGTVASARPENNPGSGLTTTTKWLLGAAALLLLIGVGVKLAKG